MNDRESINERPKHTGWHRLWSWFYYIANRASVTSRAHTHIFTACNRIFLHAEHNFHSWVFFRVDFLRTYTHKYTYLIIYWITYGSLFFQHIETVLWFCSSFSFHLIELNFNKLPSIFLHYLHHACACFKCETNFQAIQVRLVSDTPFWYA